MVHLVKKVPSQPALIQKIIRDIKLGPKMTTKPVPAASSHILHYHHDSLDFDGHFGYHSVIEQLNYVAQLTRPEIQYAVNTCARYGICARKEHGETLEYVGKYLKGTVKQGVILQPDKSKGFEVYADADFARNWLKEYAQFDPTTAKSRSCLVILYAGCPVLWASRLQSQCALSITETKYIALSMALRVIIPLMQLADEL